jgi:hypothetical protein
MSKDIFGLFSTTRRRVTPRRQFFIETLCGGIAVGEDRLDIDYGWKVCPAACNDCDSARKYDIFMEVCSGNFRNCYKGHLENMEDVK